MMLLELEKSTNVKSLRDFLLSSADEERANKLIVLTILLNSADTFFTTVALGHGVEEFNPFVAAVLNLGLIWFVFNKLILINLMILFVGLVGRDYRVGRIGMVIAAWTYTLLTIYHMVNLSLLFMTGK
jgi:hypothetical protein